MDFDQARRFYVLRDQYNDYRQKVEALTAKVKRTKGRINKHRSDLSQWETMLAKLEARLAEATDRFDQIKAEYKPLLADMRREQKGKTSL